MKGPSARELAHRDMGCMVEERRGTWMVSFVTQQRDTSHGNVSIYGYEKVFLIVGGTSGTRSEGGAAEARK